MTFKAHYLFDGYPAGSSCHGSLGWSSVTLLHSEHATVLIDTGPPSYAALMRERFGAVGLSVEQVSQVLLTHAHWDHCANIELFSEATVYIGEREYRWASSQPDGQYHVMTSPLERLERRGRLELITDGSSSIAGVDVLPTPGHTPGHLGYRAVTNDSVLVFAGDACKNREELISGTAALTLDSHSSHLTITRFREMLTGGATLVPGHDAPLQLGASGQIRPIRALTPEALKHVVPIM